MSVDFGPIPMPYSPLQDYFERKYKTPSSNVSPAIPMSRPTPNEQRIQNQLEEALAKLAERQRLDNITYANEKRKEDSDPVELQRRDSTATSTGAVLLSKHGHLKRRSVSGGIALTMTSSRRP